MTQEAVVGTPNRSFREIFSFQNVSDDILLRAMAIGMIYKEAVHQYREGMNLPEYIEKLEANIMARVGSELPGLGHPLTEEEAQAICFFFNNRLVATVFFNC